MDRECTHHNWCTLRKISKHSEINPSLSDLDNLLLALVSIVLVRTLALIRLLDLGAFSGKVGRTHTIEAMICRAWTRWW